MNQQQIITALSATEVLGRCSLAMKEQNIQRYLEDVYSMKNMKRDKDQIKSETATLEYKLSHSFPHLTLAEVQLALDAGVTGQFKDLSTVPNVANMISWIAFYNGSAERADALKAHKGKKDLADLMAKRIEREANAAKNNAECLRDEPHKAFATFLSEGRKGFCLPQYISEVVYPGLIKMGCMKNITQETLAVCRNSAMAQMRTELPNITSFTGQNAVTVETYTKREIVFRYFEALKQAGRTAL